MKRMIWLAAALLLVTACATSGGSRQSGPRDMITQDQLEAFNSSSNMELLIQSLRPSWLHERGPSSMQVNAPVRIYVNGQPRERAALRELAPGDVREVRHLSSRAATARFGTGHTNGAILITLR